MVEGAKVFIEELMRFAAEVIGRAVNDLHWGDGALVTDDGTKLFDLPALARQAVRRGRSVEALGTFFNTDLTFSYGAHAAYVAVDPRTGAVEVLDYVAVEDIGGALNPLVVHGQLIGSIVQGLGGVFSIISSMTTRANF